MSKKKDRSPENAINLNDEKTYEMLVTPLSQVDVDRKAFIAGLNGGRKCQDQLQGLGLRVGQELRVLHGGNGAGGPCLLQ